jgi:gluconolactonase
VRGRRTGAVSRVTEQGFAEILADGLEFTNGLDFHPDGMTIFVVETTSGKILRAPLDESGALAGPLEEFVRFPGRVGPDGIRFAADGDLYVTLFGRGQIAVVSPGAEVIDRIRLPGLYPTNAVFRDGNLLVCEGATGAIWSLALGVEGLPSYSERVWNGV